MNTHRITAMALAAALAGFTHTLAAEEKIGVSPADTTSVENIPEQQPPEQATWQETSTPLQANVQPADKLLSEMKVYPSF